MQAEDIKSMLYIECVDQGYVTCRVQRLGICNVESAGFTVKVCNVKV